MNKRRAQVMGAGGLALQASVIPSLCVHHSAMLLKGAVLCVKSVFFIFNF